MPCHAMLDSLILKVINFLASSKATADAIVATGLLWNVLKLMVDVNNDCSALVQPLVLALGTVSSRGVLADCTQQMEKNRVIFLCSCMAYTGPAS